MKLSMMLAWYREYDGVWLLRIRDRVFGVLIGGLRNSWHLYTPQGKHKRYPNMATFIAKIDQVVLP